MVQVIRYSLSAVTWLEYCRYGVKHKINKQSVYFPSAVTWMEYGGFDVKLKIINPSIFFAGVTKLKYF